MTLLHYQSGVILSCQENHLICGKSFHPGLVFTIKVSKLHYIAYIKPDQLLYCIKPLKFCQYFFMTRMRTIIIAQALSKQGGQGS